MSDPLELEILAERPVVRNDEPSEIDVAFDITTTKALDGDGISHAINISVVLDRSGSMSSNNKLEQAKASCISILESLSARDHLTVLAFDDEVVLVANPQTPPGEVRNRILSLSSGGATDLAKGWRLGVLELQTYSSDHHINRLILLSDGMANRGERKASVLGGESGRARDEAGITTSTIGVGGDFQEDALAILAHQSGGRFWYIGDVSIEEIIREEFSGALSVYLERPTVLLELPRGVVVAEELNDLAKAAGRYRVRPIKANDRFSFAVRLKIEPEQVSSPDLLITATLFDGAEVVNRAESVLQMSELDTYVKSPTEPRVKNIVERYVAATSDEEVVEQLDVGDITTAAEMLQTQSDLMRELGEKLAGETSVAWEEMGAKDRRLRQQELDRMYREVQENDALAVVLRLVNLLNVLGEARRADELLGYVRKLGKGRDMRRRDWHERHRSADWAAREILSRSRAAIEQITGAYPQLSGELEEIHKAINEHLARFT